MISKPNRWRAEWSHSPALQEQFASADDYAAHRAKLERERENGGPPPAAAVTETQRQAAIEALRLPGTDAAVEQAKADLATTPAMAASAIVAAYKAHLGLPASPAAVAVPLFLAGGASQLASLDQIHSEWGGSALLQAEFATPEPMPITPQVSLPAASASTARRPGRPASRRARRTSRG